MTANSRIVLNFIATYGRSLYLLGVGLVCSRWKLKILGEIDFGLYGLVGGLDILISFFSNNMAVAVARYYAYAVGQSQCQLDRSVGINICRQWFSVALFMHVVLSTVALVVGYPIGVWIIENYLTIPVDRISDCVWVWRFVSMSCFCGMLTIPYSAMYTAKQYIAELTIYSFVTATLNVVALYYMMVHPGTWLVGIAFWMSFLAILPQLIIAWRAHKLFPECRFSWMSINWNSFRELSRYASYRLIGAISSATRLQFLSILVNKMLGPTRNASMSIGHALNGHAQTFASSLEGALSPAITNAYGAGDMKRFSNLVFASCKFSVFLSLIFVLPLLCESDEVLRIWLGNPPPCSAGVACWLMLGAVLQSATSGHYMAIYASGSIKRFETITAIMGMVVFPLAWLFISLGHDVASVGGAFFAGWCFMIQVRLIVAKRVAGLSISRWINGVLLPYLIISIPIYFVGVLIKTFIRPSLGRVVYTTVSINAVFLPCFWFIICNNQERVRIVEALRSKIGKFYRK